MAYTATRTRFAVAGALLAVAAFLWAPATGAAPVVVQVGTERIVIDTPPGYADTAFIGSPRLTEFAESLLPEGNRILAFALSDADIRRFSTGDTPDLRRVLLLAVPRSLEQERVGPQQFAALAQELFGNLGESAPQGMDPMKHLDQKAPGVAHLIAELRNDASMRAVLQGTRLPGRSWGDRTTYRLSAGGLIRLGNKAMSVTVLTAYDNPADLEWIRSISLRWLDQLQRLNRQGQ